MTVKLKMVDVVELTKKLIACPSVTPEDAGAQEILTAELEALGFTVYSLPFGNDTITVPNIFARLGTDGPHLCYGGHTDVVPVGDENAWSSPPFEPTIKDGVLYGRGASDMKGSVAAFLAAAAAFLKDNPNPKGSISLIITGDEEGEAEFGTIKVLEWMEQNGHIPDVALGGEPTNPDHLGQEIKIGRRGSLSGYLSVTGKQGHVAYQHLADNPLPILARMADALASYEFDQGTEFFAPTNLELTSMDVGNDVSNIIPAQGSLTFNVRFTDKWNQQTLSDKVHEILRGVSENYEIKFHCGAESFMTQPSAWTEIVKDSVTEIAGKTPEYTTTGGTSDARFMAQYCPVIECGAVNASIHQVDENAKISDLEDLAKIYQRVLEKYFS